MTSGFCSPGGFCSRRVLLALVGLAVCSTASATLLALSRSETLLRASHRSLSFEARISYQRKIEEVYWRHRTASGEAAKSSLQSVLPPAELKKKVHAYLHDSRVL